jgi:hypothetical protein
MSAWLQDATDLPQRRSWKVHWMDLRAGVDVKAREEPLPVGNETLGI